MHNNVLNGLYKDFYCCSNWSPGCAHSIPETFLQKREKDPLHFSLGWASSGGENHAVFKQDWEEATKIQGVWTGR